MQNSSCVHFSADVSASFGGGFIAEQTWSHVGLACSLGLS